MTVPGTLRRRLGVSDAIVVGAGSMIGAGVFVVWGPAADAAGSALLIGLAVAGVVALCNATSSAQLAAVYPESGGTYVYGQRQLGPFWGRVAGWGFVVGKVASCSTMALTVGAYAWPDRARAVAVLSVGLILAVNLRGLSRTVAVTRGLLLITLSTLVLVVVLGWSRGGASFGSIEPVDAGAGGILRSAGLLFFAFAGYARIATLGEEVRDPARTIPRAIPLALGAVLVVYAAVGVTVLAVVPLDELARTSAPLDAVVEKTGLRALGSLVTVGAAVAAFGVLLNLLPGIARTLLAMARHRDVPPWFAHVNDRGSSPVRAEVTIAAVVVAVILVLDLTSSLSVSGVAVLTYYAITNVAALTLGDDQRRWPRAIAVVGTIGCAALIFSLEPSAIAIGFGCVIAGTTLGSAGRWLLGRRARSRADATPT
jgi:basic amino acid/polyamine antiporter, APA family